MEFEAVIGLEVHAQLSTNSKIFCSCSTSFGAEANTNVCPVCLGMPGVLPVLNKEVVNRTIKTGLALGCTINKRNIFARKNYFYPDLPKGYQTSQLEAPICLGGQIEVELESGEKRTIELNRIHMEEDAGKSIHGDNLGSPGNSYIDLNRTGTPLMEIVTEPVIRTAEEARLYLQKLKSILEYCGVSDCNMEEGSFRCDANISIRPVGETKLGTKTEVKNMNSFRNVQRAIEYEIKRQIKVVRDGGKIVQETRLWNPDKAVTFSMRSKEEAHDYRYFPCPDLVPLDISDAWIDEVRATLPELPDAKIERFMADYGLSRYDADRLAADKSYADYFEAAVAVHNNPKAISNWVMGEVLRVVNEKGCAIADTGVSPQALGDIIKMLDENKISGNSAKDVFQDVIATGKTPAQIVDEKGLAQVSDSSELEGIVKQVLEANPDECERYKNGDKKLIGFFMGQIMRASKGKANPKIVGEIMDKLLK